MGNSQTSATKKSTSKEEEEVHKVERGLKVVLLTKGDPRLHEASRVLSRAFCGTTAVRPEGLVDWVYAGEAQTRGAPLDSKPTETREKWFDWFATWAVTKTLWSRGSIYALLDDTDTIIAATALLPPSDKANYKTSTLQFVRLVLTVGAPSKTDSDYKACLDRLDVLEKAMHDFHARHAAAPHWYVFCFGVDPGAQGRGYGGVLLRFVCTLADRDGATAYLETDGERNVGFYSAKGGFKVVERRALTCRGVTFDSDGGAYAMVRPASKETTQAPQVSKPAA